MFENIYAAVKVSCYGILGFKKHTSSLIPKWILKAMFTL